MRIAFLDPTWLDYTPATPLAQPLGGTQSAACYLSVALAERGHEVTILNGTSTPGRVMGVGCGRYDPDNIASQVGDMDAVVVLTAPIANSLRDLGVTARLINWQHKAADSNGAKPFVVAEERAAWSATVFVSEFQRKGFVEKWGIDGQVLRNAVSPSVDRTPRTEPNFVDRNEDPTLIYASAPGRGLDFLLFAFSVIRRELPNARLKIFSDQSMYQIAPDKDEFQAYYEMAKALPGVEYSGAVSQNDLAQAYVASDIWAYPTTFIETSCIVLMEAAAGGCLLLSSESGALRETSGRFGRLLRPGNSRAGWALLYAQTLLKEVARVRAGPDAYRQFMGDQMAHFRRECSWSNRASEWEHWLLETRIASA